MTQSRKNEIVVGGFVLIAVAVMFAMTFIIRGSTGMSPYIIRTEFKNVSGLELGSPVLVQGFRTGRVTDMEAGVGEDGVPTVIVEAKVSRSIPIYKNGKVQLVQQGFIGDKRLEIIPGTPDAGEIERSDMLASVPPTDFLAVFAEAGQIIEDLQVTVANLREFTSNRERLDRIDQTIANLESSSQRVNAMLEENRTAVSDTVDNVRSASEQTLEVAEKMDLLLEKVDGRVDTVGGSVEQAIAQLRDDTRQLSQKLDRVLSRAEEVGTNANDLLVSARSEVESVSQNLQSVSDNLNEVLDRINSGEGTVGRLITDPSAYESLQESIESLRSVLKQDREEFYDRRVPYRPSIPDEAKGSSGGK